MNLLPLEIFRRILKYPPYQFWGMDNTDVGLGSQCNGVVPEYAFANSDVGGRDDIRQAIEQAEKKLRGLLQFPVAPQYLEATLAYPPYLDQRIFRYGELDGNGGWVTPKRYRVVAPPPMSLY